MAWKSSDSSEKILLEERDIPGAELPRPAEQCTKAMLKRWLSCVRIIMIIMSAVIRYPEGHVTPSMMT